MNTVSVLKKIFYKTINTHNLPAVVDTKNQEISIQIFNNPKSSKEIFCHSKSIFVIIKAVTLIIKRQNS